MLKDMAKFEVENAKIVEIYNLSRLKNFGVNYYSIKIYWIWNDVYDIILILHY